jgi:hypothetical protein
MVTVRYSHSCDSVRDYVPCDACVKPASVIMVPAAGSSSRLIHFGGIAARAAAVRLPGSNLTSRPIRESASPASVAIVALVFEEQAADLKVKLLRIREVVNPAHSLIQAGGLDYELSVSQQPTRRRPPEAHIRHLDER